MMYFNLEAEALHGAYWHNNFGSKMSHGCVSLPLYFSSLALRLGAARHRGLGARIDLAWGLDRLDSTNRG